MSPLQQVHTMHVQMVLSIYSLNNLLCMHILDASDVNTVLLFSHVNRGDCSTYILCKASLLLKVHNVCNSVDINASSNSFWRPQQMCNAWFDMQSYAYTTVHS
jgi:hypothetical protein